MNMNNKMQNSSSSSSSSSILKVALTAAVMIATCTLAEYVIDDYQARASEREALLEQARIYKSHPLVVNGCDTDLQCKELDHMLAVIEASYECD